MKLHWLTFALYGDMKTEIIPFKLGLTSCYLIIGISSFGPGLPILAQDIGAIKENRKVLINGGVTFACPGHGKLFPVEVIKNQLIT